MISPEESGCEGLCHSPVKPEFKVSLNVACETVESRNDADHKTPRPAGIWMSFGLISAFPPA